MFSFASGIFHPYYVSYLAPMIAVLVGAGAGMMLGSRIARHRIVAPALIAGGAITELVVLGEIGGQLAWAVPVVVGGRRRRRGRCSRRRCRPARRAGSPPVIAGRGAAGRAGNLGGGDTRPRHEQHLPDRRPSERIGDVLAVAVWTNGASISTLAAPAVWCRFRRFLGRVPGR